MVVCVWEEAGMCGAVCVGGGWDEWWCVCGRRLG